MTKPAIVVAPFLDIPGSKYIIAHGSIYGGYSFVGPFATVSEAKQYAREMRGDGNPGDDERYEIHELYEIIR